MRKFLTFIICLSILIAGAVIARNNHWFDSPTAFAVGDLTVNWGVVEGNPIFTITNAAPGDSATRTVAITNNSSSTKELGIKGLVDSVSPATFPEVLNIEIKEGATTIYNDSLSDFFASSSGINGFSMGTIASGATRNINIKITFDINAGNEYQDADISFDLIIGIVIDIPLSCQNMHFNGATIFGTDGNDNIKSGNKSQLIVLFGGNDTVSSGNGADCVVGTTGNKNIKTGNGKDRVVLGNGNSTISTGNSEDIVNVGNGNNTVRLGNGRDIFTALGGENIVSGENGNDNINNGSVTSGTVLGGQGVDTCVARTKSSCEN